MRLLIANRGEIAVRIARTARRLGLETVTVFSDGDRDAVHAAAGDASFHLGPDDAYLQADLLVDVAQQSGADAVHPGYGFLSESPDFARQVSAAGLLWVGPDARVIDAMGSKHDAREFATQAGVPVLPGLVVDGDDVGEAAAQLGFPLMVKASRGGGGMGLRVVRDLEALQGSLTEARQQAERAFGDGALILERYLERPRHVEVQIVADRHGTVLALGDRDCSLQRRHQKLIEETPAPGLEPATRTALHAAAEKLAAHIGYDSVGTAEFLLDDVTGEFYFLEMNTRLQVEHTVTEAVTGLDLVELQIRAARGERLDDLAATTARPGGCAIEARITAEDAWAGYLPSSGRIERYRAPAGVRVDSGIAEGSVVTSRYDPLLLKVVVHEPTREAAVARLDQALRELDVRSVATPADHLVAALASAAYRDGQITTRLLEDAAARPDVPPEAFIAAAAWLAAEGRTSLEPDPGPWRSLRDWRLLGSAPVRTRVLASLSGRRHEVHLQERPRGTDGAAGYRAGLDAPALTCDVDLLPDGRVRVSTDGVARLHTCRRHRDEIVVHRPGLRVTLGAVPEAELADDARHPDADHDGAVRSPFPATVVEVYAHDGQPVAAGEVLVVVEAMKMLHSLTAPFEGVVTGIDARPGETARSQQVLATVRKTDT